MVLVSLKELNNTSIGLYRATYCPPLYCSLNNGRQRIITVIRTLSILGFKKLKLTRICHYYTPRVLYVLLGVKLAPLAGFELNDILRGLKSAVSSKGG